MEIASDSAADDAAADDVAKDDADSGQEDLEQQLKKAARLLETRKRMGKLRLKKLLFFFSFSFFF